ncbi:MAG TPA: ABC transporter permease [Candidatus Limnocylindrales bacterium]|nr:ABC transporter permease [Candidatus Limnocylindrales bacterium]
MRLGYVGRRLTSALFTIVLIALINFVLFRAMPGSPERVILRGTPNVTQAQLDAAKQRWGLDKPVFPDQFVSYVGATLRGDLGYSFIARGQTVTDVLAQRIWPTLILFGLGELVAIVIGLVLGAYSGWRRGGLIDYVGNGVSLVLYSAPYFILGMAFLLIFATTLRWFPTFGMLTAGATYPGLWERFVDFLAHLTLPLVTVAIGLVGQYAIVMRSSIVETLAEDYVTTARGMGLRDGRILRHHALPNALLPTVSLIAINLGYVVAGAITLEVVFNWPGLGTLTVEALTARDYPVLQGVFLLLGISVVLANLVADLVYAALDPRVRT